MYTRYKFPLLRYFASIYLAFSYMIGNSTQVCADNIVILGPIFDVAPNKIENLFSFMRSGKHVYESAEALSAGGRDATDSTVALQAAINAAIAAGRKGLTLAAGVTYPLSLSALGSDGAGVALKIANATDFTLDCQGSTLALKSPATGAIPRYGHTLRVENSTRVTLDRCPIDYINLPFTQATLASVNVTAKTATFTLDPAFPIAWDRLQQIESYDPAIRMPTGWVMRWPGGDRAVTVSGNSATVDFSASADTARLSSLVVGGSYILSRQIYNGDAINVENVDGMTIRRTPIYAAAGIGIRTFNSTNITVEDGSGARIKTGRWRSTNADASHFADTRGLLIVRGNTIEGSGDDGLTVYPIGRTVASVSGATFVIPKPTPLVIGTTLSYSWKVGDTLSFAGAGGAYLGTAVITSLSPSGSNLAIGTAALPAATVSGTFVWNSSVSPQTTVRGNLFQRIRGSAVVLGAERGEVAGNTIRLTTSEGIVVGGAYWTSYNEGGAPRSVVVSDNDIVDAMSGPDAVSFGYAAIAAYRGAPNGSTSVAPAGLLDIVSIRNNRIRRTRNGCIYATSISALDLTSNTCDAWAQRPDGTKPWAANSFTLFNIASGRVTLGPLLNAPTGAQRGYASTANVAATIDSGIAHYQPHMVSGNTYMIPDGASHVMLHSDGGPIASYGVTMPASPVDQQQVTLSTDQNITALTVSTVNGQSITSPPTKLSRFAHAEFIWVQQNTTWHRVR